MGMMMPIVTDDLIQTEVVEAPPYVKTYKKVYSAETGWKDQVYYTVPDSYPLDQHLRAVVGPPSYMHGWWRSHNKITMKEEHYVFWLLKQ